MPSPDPEHRPILNTGPVDDEAGQESGQKTGGIGDAVALAPLDPFFVRAASAAPPGPRSALTIAANPVPFRGPDALAVDYARRRARAVPFGLARHPDKGTVDRMPSSAAAPVGETAPHRRDRLKVIGQHPPLAPCRRDGEDRVENRTQIGHARSANALAHGQAGTARSTPIPHRSHRLRSCPLRSYCRRVRSVQAIGFSILYCSRTESQPAEFTQLISDQTQRVWATNPVVTLIAPAWSPHRVAGLNPVACSTADRPLPGNPPIRLRRSCLRQSHAASRGCQGR